MHEVVIELVQNPKLVLWRLIGVTEGNRGLQGMFA